ncbi:hypothetical protein KCU71_g124, partial [Aureobasidium melanogenum]
MFMTQSAWFDQKEAATRPLPPRLLPCSNISPTANQYTTLSPAIVTTLVHCFVFRLLSPRTLGRLSTDALPSFRPLPTREITFTAEASPSRHTTRNQINSTIIAKEQVLTKRKINRQSPGCYRHP